MEFSALLEDTFTGTDILVISGIEPVTLWLRGGLKPRGHILAEYISRLSEWVKGEALTFINLTHH